MEEVKKKATTLKAEIDDAAARLNINGQKNELDELTEQSQASDFWQNNLKAQATMKQIAKLQHKLEPWTELIRLSEDSYELAKLGDKSIKDELNTQLDDLKSEFDKLKSDLKFSGPYDDHDAILSIYAGAGGTDAQDWAQMLLRMYSRWAEKSGLELLIIDQTTGEEAGLKSVSVEIVGSYAYGKLKSENGVHRLVRLSPFNADNLRQTSFARVEVLPEIATPEEVDIDSKDLRIDVYRSGGHGGQSVNTTDSAVRVTHLPTNINVAIQNERSQLQNKELALTIIRSRLAQLQLEQHTQKLSDLKGPLKAAEWGNQIRSYVLHPYKQVKDLRSGYESSEPDKVLDGDIDPLINAYLDKNLVS